MAKEQKENPNAATTAQTSPEKQKTSIVRIANKDINGNLKIGNALTQIKGLGYNIAHSIALSAKRQYGISEETKLGTLTDDQLAKLEIFIRDPSKAKIPSYLLNRRKDSETGADMHLVGTDLMVKVKQNIDNDIKDQNYRGFRHKYGQKVRGQRTRSTGRTGVTVGVTKKAAQEQQKAATAGKKPEGGAAPAK